MMIATGISSGHVTAADWLWLIAAVLFALAFIINVLGGTAAAKVNPLNLLFAGLTLTVIAFMIL